MRARRARTWARARSERGQLVGAAHFYNQRGTAEQWIKAGKAATRLTCLSYHRFPMLAVLVGSISAASRTAGSPAQSTRRSHSSWTWPRPAPHRQQASDAARCSASLTFRSSMMAADTATPQPKAWHSLSSTCGPGENTWVALETLGAKTSRRRQGASAGSLGAVQTDQGGSPLDPAARRRSAPAATLR